MIFKVALKDLKSNIGHFTVYGLALALAIAVYFFFANLTYNPSYQNIDYHLLSGFSMMSISIIAMITKISELAFIILFLVIASILLFKISKKNLASLLIAGFNKGQVVTFFALQQFVIHFISLIVGIVMGIIITPLLNLLLIRLLGWQSTWSMVFKMPVQDTFFTFLLVFWLQFLIFIIVTRLIKNPTYFNKYANPKKSEIKRRKLRRSPGILATIFQLFLLIGILMSLVVFMKFPFIYALLALLFLITFFRWWIFRVLEKRKHKRKATDFKILVYSHLKRSLSDSTWTAIVIAVINMLAIIALFIFTYGDNGLAQSNVKNNPTEFVTTSFTQNKVEQAMRDNGLDVQYQQVTPIKLLYYTNFFNQMFGVISQSDYNRGVQQGFLNRQYSATNRPNATNDQVGAKALFLNSGQFNAAPYQFLGNEIGLTLKNGQTKTFELTNQSSLFSDRLIPFPQGSVPTHNLIVSDVDFDQIQADITYQVISYDIKPQQLENYRQVLTNLVSYNILPQGVVADENTSKLTLEKESEASRQRSDSYHRTHDTYYFSSYNSYYKSQVSSSYTLSNIQFILIIFSGLLIVATQVILLLKLNTDFGQNLADYQYLVKLGHLKTDIKKLVFKYTAYYFLMPTLFVMVYMILLLIPFIVALNFKGYLSFFTLCGLVIGFTIVSYYAIYKNYWYLVKQRI
ncbi:hypothetical protein [Holzapfeliella sp. JNUCC 72]